ncbi:tRNA (adenosine(37)-N6)-threonylcarbamoyltransferase complex dimerization subunit type 1 TsaB [Pseudoalteromonas sp. NEC-BIFX-2020_015]|uniref:tRNA (adenosine(37)-N6)-threonylcarbamoyltransferase complex dimerization subunit type 1 TsaB n=1 Tax=Pseudoalteromonas sp. NEC-BIFX-2020_015 TaxID=2729544 RepID=UPI00146141DC|nr:tRNA (adenosine(37)-N6)-threonylcarbamoyltransferase complex dimerization subunit type 1 TsaB [Pseudoalteromonas sp. NEC-BIFX-2020_015]NMR25564.1 tRNA (adenosine(37)-N6)-threonylcarbamoyltransferase complex dimerization subunit type 1 TsaB [Pseudoalteromonas sp. NEC-BIFX-2020_015]
MSNQMNATTINFLALDASTEALSLVLNYNGQTFHHFEECPQQHSQKILPLVDELLSKANCRLNDLDVIGFGQGPGSFTGVRISVAIAQGLAYACKLPLVGVSTLQMMAQQTHQQTGDKSVYCAIDARMGEIYFAHYMLNDESLMVLQGEEQVLKPDALILDNPEGTAVGTGWKTYPNALDNYTNITINNAITLPDAGFMVAHIDYAFANQHTVSPAQAQPKYVRDTVTWKKLPGRE